MNTFYKPLKEKIYPRPFKKEEESYFSPAIDKNTTPYIRWEDLSTAERIINVAAILFLIWLFVKLVL